MKIIFLILFFPFSAMASELKEIANLEDSNAARKEEHIEIIRESLVSDRILTEEKLKRIIRTAEEAGDPELIVDRNHQDYIIKNDIEKYINPEIDRPESAVVNKYYDFIDTLNEKLKEHDFEDKTEVVHVGREVTKELRSDKILSNAEVGVGISYQNKYNLKKDRKIFDQEQSGKLYIKEASKDTDVQAIPLYITGRYNLPSIDDGSPYLKLNLGYAFNNVNNRNFQSANSKYQSIDNEVNSKSGSYYGIGGGIEYENGLTLDLIYQVSEDNGSSRNGKTEDNRTTFSVKYKLDI